MADTVEIDILARVDQAISGIEQFINKIAAAYISVEGFKKLVVGSFEAYEEAENSQARLGAALMLTGQYSQQALTGFTQYAHGLQDMTTFSHVATEGASALLMEIGHLSISGVEAIMPHLQDFAAAMGIDLKTAATQAAQAIEGGRNTFQRYGIDLRGAHDETSRFDTLMQGLTKDFGSMADKMASTSSGQLAQFKNNIHDVGEEIGLVFARIMNPTMSSINTAAAVGHLLDINPKTITDLGQARTYVAEMSKYIADYTKWSGDHPVLAALWGEPGFLEQVKMQMVAIAQQAQILSKTGGGSPITGGAADETDKTTTATDKGTEAWKEYWKSQNDVIQNDNELIKTQAAAQHSLDMMTLSAHNTDDVFSQLSKLTSGPMKKDFAEFNVIVDDLGHSITTAGKAIGSAFVTGDWEGAMKTMAADLAELLATQALSAAAAAAITYNWPMVAFWLGVAGVAAVGGGAIGSMSSGGSPDNNFPHYDSGTDYVPQTGLALVHQGEQIIPPGGRGGTTINNFIYGGMWQADDLAKQMIRATRRW